MKYLGIDFGSKRIGLAVSDASESFAMPLRVLSHAGNMKDIVEEVEAVCLAEKVDAVVVGESKDFAQQDNEIMKEVRVFVEELKQKTGLPVHLHPEFMTSLEAEQIQGKNNMLDASAAAIILKSYLDTLSNNLKL